MDLEFASSKHIGVFTNSEFPEAHLFQFLWKLHYIVWLINSLVISDQPHFHPPFISGGHQMGLKAPTSNHWVGCPGNQSKFRSTQASDSSLMGNKTSLWRLQEFLRAVCQETGMKAQMYTIYYKSISQLHFKEVVLRSL